MDVRVVRDAAEWDTLEADWRRIVEDSPAATVFQTWDWLRTWWTHRGRHKRLWLLRFIDDGNATVGFAPLFLPPIGAPFRVARFIGTGGSDYLDLIAAPGHEDAVAAAFPAFLREHRREWDWADLQQVRPGGVAARVAAFDPRTSDWPGETCPFLPLPGDWDAFRRGLSKKMRGNIGYYERALEKVYTLEMRLASHSTLDDDLDAFFDLHQRRWNRKWYPGAFASRASRAFHEDVARRLLASGKLRLHVLALDGETQATIYCFQHGLRCFYYLGGFEPTLARLSLGTVLTARAIRHAIEADHADEFDLLRGNEPYKYKWGAQDRFNLRLSMTQRGVRSTLLAGTGRAGLRAEMGLKDWMHHRGQKKHG